MGNGKICDTSCNQEGFSSDGITWFDLLFFDGGASVPFMVALFIKYKIPPRVSAMPLRRAMTLQRSFTLFNHRM